MERPGRRAGHRDHQTGEEKRGGGVSVPVEAFEGRNPVFVDEGHNGSGASLAQVSRRSGRYRLHFRVCATFGQAHWLRARSPHHRILQGHPFRLLLPLFYGDVFRKDFRI